MSTTFVSVSEISAELQRCQRHRAILIKSRNMQANRLQAIVAGTLGYTTSMSEKDRAKKFVEATALIRSIPETPQDGEHELADIIRTTLIGVGAFENGMDRIEKLMKAQAKELPVASWVAEPEQRGFGLLFLGIVIGETGDLANYPNPAKVWRRLGCAPWTFDRKTAMGATWRSGKEGKLPASEWESYGYSPRRRSIAYLIGENIVKQNKSIYRARYDNTKARLKEVHPDYSDLRCHRHGMLLATKLLLKNLWIEWNR